VLNREAPKFIRKVVFAMVDPIQNLPLGILRFSKDGFPIDTQSSVQPANGPIRPINRF
jgi:hypothetical protein